MIPLLLLLNLLPGMNPKGTRSFRLKICNHGTLILMMFVGSLIPSLAWHAVLAFFTIPNSYMDWVWSAVYCVVASAVLFWNGILCVYLTSSQLGLKWRVIGLACGLIPIANLVVLYKILKTTTAECFFEQEKAKINRQRKPQP
jgi:triacylglycerol lipase